MQRSARVVLWRPWRPGVKVVTVRSFTVGRFLGFLERAGALAVQLKVRLNRDLTGEDILAAELSAADWSDLADYACPDERPGWFRPWFCAFNLRRMMTAFGDLRSGGVNDWRRITGEALNLTGEPRKSGTVQGDIARLCGFYPGMTPFDVYRQDLVEFLDMVAGIAASEEETEEKEQEPVPLSALGMDGVGVVH